MANQTFQQADGYIEPIEELSRELAAEADEETPLVAELIDTVTIEQLLDRFISEVGEMFTDTLDVSLEGNAVKTHLELVNFGQDTIELAYRLRGDLLRSVAVRSEQFEEKEVISPIANLSVGDQLRKQIVDEQAETEQES